MIAGSNDPRNGRKGSRWHEGMPGTHHYIWCDTAQFDTLLKVRTTSCLTVMNTDFLDSWTLGGLEITHHPLTTSTVTSIIRCTVGTGARISTRC